MKQLILTRVEVIYGKRLKNELIEELKENKEEEVKNEEKI